ncbi:hypothetical protein MLD38_027687 [Melastoma candidum]|uniref:Uncharacterized protein n=1 Tax=Melastoma candidum TaxID=119954 RepID=A0ACB9P488_9MYRT|nr:hypothetical protein MLD38_027687 [Melastoma candidum]
MASPNPNRNQHIPKEDSSSLNAIKQMSSQLESRISSTHASQIHLISSLQQTLIPNLISSLDSSLFLISSLNDRPFCPTPSLPNPDPRPNLSSKPRPDAAPAKSPSRARASAGIRSDRDDPDARLDGERILLDDSNSSLSVVRSMVAVCLLERVPFTVIDSSTVLRKLENDPNTTAAEKAALREVGGESGTILAVEMALRSIAEDNGGVELEEFVVSGKSRVLVLGIDRTRLLKELPESANYNGNSGNNSSRQPDLSGRELGNPGISGSGLFVMGGPGVRPMGDMWMGPGGDPHMIMGPRGVSPRVMGVMGIPPRGMLHKPPLMGSNAGIGGGGVGNGVLQKSRSEEDELKDLEALLNKKSFREMQKSKTGEELLDLIHRPTAKETAVAAKFKTKGGSQLKEYCSSLTKEDCRRQSGSFIACEKVHFRRIIAPHTDINLGDCSFLDTCRHMKTCKYVHYELDPTPDVPPMMMGATPPPKVLKPQRAEYCSEVELGESQWINCDIRTFRMDIIGQFGVIMADPPWDIHMELPYGTMADDEMRTLNVPALQTDGLIFLWVTGRAMELGRECLELWGYKRVEEIIWVKTNQLQRIIRTGRTGHWLNHSKEHCLVGIKGNPEVNRNIDTDVIVAEVRETSRKPDEMYPLLERISPRTRKLELFARMHNTHSGWISLGNQLNGVRLVDEGLRARFKAAYPDVEVQPPSPPRASAMEIDSTGPQSRSPFTSADPAKSTSFSDSGAMRASYDKPSDVDIVS